MSQLQKEIRDYTDRRRRIDTLTEELERVEKEHAEKTRVAFGLSDGDMIGLPQLAELVAKVSNLLNEPLE